MKLITSNIRFDNAEDNENSWKFRKELLSKTLLSYSPDIIATQEGREPQLRDFAGLLRGYKLCDENRAWIDPRMYPCFFSGDDIIDSGDLWLSDTPQIAGTKLDTSMFPRLMTWIKCVHENQEVLLVNVHLDHSSQSARDEQSQILIDQIKIINTKELPLILMGDFNSSPTSRVYRLLKEKLELVDPWVLSKKAEESTYHKFEGKFEKGSRIDWILYSNHFKLNKIELIKTSDKGRFPSDHFPLFCDIILNNK